MKAAERPRTDSVRKANVRVSASHGLTPNRMLEISRPPPAASGRPAPEVLRFSKVLRFITVPTF
jgi:hypothetical protein